MSAPRASATYRWQGTTWGELEFDVDGCVTNRAPPRRLTSSMRTIVRDGQQVLVCQTSDGPHIWPGGGPEPNEDPLETVIREVREETGWIIQVERRLGFIRFRHRQPMPEGYPYPYPDFYQLVFLSAPRSHLTGGQWRDVEGWEHSSAFVPVGDLPELDAVQNLFLSAAYHELP